MSAQIFCIGANHRTADIEHREGFFLPPEELMDALPLVQQKHHLVELLVLSTCNRFELLGVYPDETPPHDPLSLWEDIHSYSSRSRHQERQLIERMTYQLLGEDAVRHAFMVASSLDSLVPGETQITGQFRDAVELAQKARTLGPVLSRLSQEAIAAAKKVRSQTSIGQRTVSISHAAVTLAKRMFHDLSDCRFLIIGAGEMARVSAEHALSYQPKHIRIANRTPSKAYELAQHLGSSEGYGLDHLPKLLAQSDVVIVATSAGTPIITQHMLKSCLKDRDTNQPLFLVDISLPRNIDPECRTFEDVYLFDIDDLKQVVDQHLSERHAAAAEASIIIDQASSGFQLWLSTQELNPILEAWKVHVQETLAREAKKTLSRDIFQTLDTRQQQAIQDMLQAITARLSSDLASGLKKTEIQEAHRFAKSIRHIFSLNILDKQISNKQKKDSPS